MAHSLHRPSNPPEGSGVSRRTAVVDEFTHIDWIVSQLPKPPADLLVGPGDDCAVWQCGERIVLLKVDSLLEASHFQRTDPAAPGYATPEQIGRKAIARAVSDIAAMGGVPRHVLVAGVVPQGGGRALREGLVHGMLDACNEFEITLAGGDTTPAAADVPLMLSVTLVGEMQSGVRPVLRSGAKHGDAIFVTGALGGSVSARHLSFKPRIAEGQWLAKLGVGSMIDVSDGLAQDLWQIARASGVGATISLGQLKPSEDALEAAAGDALAARRSALSDGEDYELLFTANEDLSRKIERDWPFDTPLSRIGQMTPLREGEKPGQGLWLEDRGQIGALATKGWRPLM